MQTSRRGFFGLITAAPVIGNSIVKEAATLENNLISGINTNIELPSKAEKFPSIKNKVSENLISETEKLLKCEAIKEYYKNNKISDEEKQRWLINYNCNKLDPDLHANRSMSLSAKICIQRNRDWEQYKTNILNQAIKVNSISLDIILKKRNEFIKNFFKKRGHELNEENNDSMIWF